MQRRATVLYAAFFLLVATGAFTVLTVTDRPTASVENPEYALSTGENFSVGERTYNVTEVSARMSSGDLVRSATAEWVDESARNTATWANDSTVSYRNDTYRVLIPDESAPSAATLREVRSLDNDTTTVEQRNRTFVVANASDGNKTLVPVEEYRRRTFGEPETKRLTPGATFQYEGNRTTVTNLTRGSVTVAWTAPRTNTIEFGETTALKTILVRGGVPERMQFPAGGNNVTLNGERFTTHYPDNGTLVLSDQLSAYQSSIDRVEHENERIAGIWGVLILSALAAAVLVGTAFLPNK